MLPTRKTPSLQIHVHTHTRTHYAYLYVESVGLLMLIPFYSCNSPFEHANVGELVYTENMAAQLHSKMRHARTDLR